jgi:hypothetical protein
MNYWYENIVQASFSIKKYNNASTILWPQTINMIIDVSGRKSHRLETYISDRFGTIIQNFT